LGIIKVSTTQGQQKELMQIFEITTKKRLNSHNRKAVYIWGRFFVAGSSGTSG